MRKPIPYRRAKACYLLRRFLGHVALPVLLSALIWGSLGFAFGGVYTAQWMADEIDQRFVCTARHAD